MILLNFQGLNCYYNCIVSIANAYGLNYLACFASLWSETDFKYDKFRDVFLTKRMLSILAAMGVNLVMLDCAPPVKGLDACKEGEYIMIGMDVYYLPWNSLYKLHHGPHYFIARYTKAEVLTCFDPTYGNQNEHIHLDEVVPYVFDISRLCCVEKKSVPVSVQNEAKEILLNHSYLYDKLIAPGDELWVAKYVDAMIHNRYLYRHFLQCQQSLFARLFDQEFFLDWAAVKNGLYKAAVRKDRALINEVHSRIKDILDKEAMMAQQIKKRLSKR